MKLKISNITKTETGSVGTAVRLRKENKKGSVGSMLLGVELPKVATVDAEYPVEFSVEGEQLVLTINDKKVKLSALGNGSFGDAETPELATVILRPSTSVTCGYAATLTLLSPDSFGVK